MDLDLIGPDNRRRSFELYWREESGPVSVKLKPETVALSDDHELTAKMGAESRRMAEERFDVREVNETILLALGL